MKITKLLSNLVYGVRRSLWVKYTMAFIELSSFIDKEGKINHVFNKFKTKDHHEVVLEYIENYR